MLIWFSLCYLMVNLKSKLVKIMKKIFSILLILSISFAGLSQKNNYKIKIKIDGMKESPCYLINYFGKQNYYKDTAQFNNDGVIVFEGEEHHPGGTYILYDGTKMLFEFIINGESLVDLETDTLNPIGNMKVNKSKENEIFFEHLQLIGAKQKAAQPLRNKLANEKTSEADKKKISAELAAIGEEIKHITIFGNFGMTTQNIDPAFQETGTWYNLLNKNMPIEVTNVSTTISLEPGGFFVYGDNPFKDINDVSLAGSGDLISKDQIITNDLNISLAGSGDIILNVKTQSVKGAVAGSGDISLKGSTNNLLAKVAGSGDFNSYELNANDAEVSIAGSGDVQVSASNNLKARVAGSGDVTYRGNPTVDKKVAGSGNISKD